MPIETVNANTAPMDPTFTTVMLSDPRGPRTIGAGTIGLPRTPNAPIQIVGAVPMSPCSSTECRVDPDCCYPVRVLAQVTANNSPDPYFNDMNSFLFNFPTWTATNNTINAAFYLDKNINGAWIQQASLNNSTNGLWYNFNTWTNHPTYTGILVKWSMVLANFGEGTYRVRLSWGMIGQSNQCMSSEPFCLLTWSCIRANKTVKFESWMGYQIGSKTVESLIYDLCGINWYDSIRFRGKFGYEDTEYEEKIVKLVSGLVNTTREEALQNYTLKTSFLPKWLHDRFKIYFHMADELRVCDYNYTNADWNLNRKRIRRNSGYKPAHNDHVRKSKVTCQYRERVESVVKSICCDNPKGGK